MRDGVWRASIFALVVTGCVAAVQTQSAPPPARALLDTYCVTCHNQRLRTAGLALDTLDVTRPVANADVWERVIAKLRAGSMPPPGLPRPDAATYDAVASSLETDIDRAWAANPNPGRSNAVHRLNRTRIQQRHPRPVRARSADFDVRRCCPETRRRTAASTTSRMS